MNKYNGRSAHPIAQWGWPWMTRRMLRCYSSAGILGATCPVTRLPSTRESVGSQFAARQFADPLADKSGFYVFHLDGVSFGGIALAQFASPKSSSQLVGMQHPLRRRAPPGTDLNANYIRTTAHDLEPPLSREGDKHVAQKPFSQSGLIHTADPRYCVPGRGACLCDCVQGRGQRDLLKRNYARKLRFPRYWHRVRRHRSFCL